MLRHGLQTVVELFRHAGPQFLEQGLEVQTGKEDAEHPAEPAELGEVGEQRFSRAGVLNLHRDVTAVLPDRAVNLPDGCRRGRPILEVPEICPPLRAKLAGQNPVDGGGRKRRGVLLQAGQRFPVRRREVVRHCCFEDGERLAELHRTAFQLPEDVEELLGGPPLEFADHLLGRASGQAFPDAHGRATRRAERQSSKAGGPRYGPPRDVGHGSHLPVFSLIARKATRSSQHLTARRH